MGSNPLINKTGRRRNPPEKEGSMKEYNIKYYLGNMLHSYIIEAKNECEAIEKALKRIPETSKKHFHDFSIERHFERWN